jgi:murein DD-endopeptidase MepM/ murein hydrolase activator NlpD
MNKKLPVWFGSVFLVMLLASLSCNVFTNLAGSGSELESTLPPVQTVELTPPAVQAAPTAETLPTQPAASQPDEEPSPTAAPQVGSSQPACEDEICTYDHVFVLKRPIGEGGRYTIVPTARFGTYDRGLKAGRHGVSFLNSTGTPVLAAADGKVVLSGNDSSVPQALYKNYYGNLVILEHHMDGHQEPIYTLYGHLSQTLVEKGDQVKAGEPVGLVGSTGDVGGSTLDFEVRFGEDNYNAARNPELWLQPIPDESGELQGALAGRVLDSQGKYVSIDNIVIERLAGPGQRALDTKYLKTYAENRLKGTDPWQESFAIGDMPAGSYQITFYYGPDLVQRVVEIQPGELTVVTIQLP